MQNQGRGFDARSATALAFSANAHRVVGVDGLGVERVHDPAVP
jgi:hypothetical protein